MEEMYSQIRENLRKSHYQNTKEVSERERNPIYRYNNGTDRYVRDEVNTRNSWTFSLKFKIFVFLFSVVSFSCYIYGGQDIEKGAVMAIGEMKEAVSVLEEKEPMVKEAMGYIRNAYHQVCDYVEE